MGLVDEGQGEQPLVGGLAGRHVRGLAETIVVSRGQTVRTRARGEAMIELARVLATLRADGQIAASEPDGAAWSMTITTPASGVDSGA